MGLFSKKEKKETLDQGLNKTKESFFSKLSKAILGKSTVDENVLDNLEETLITSDVGVETTLKIIERLEERIKRDKYISTSELNSILRAEIATLLKKHDGKFPEDFDAPLPHHPYVVLVVGVNGVGKTTTIAKLAYQYKQAGKKVMLGAADTFRAAAVEQLQLVLIDTAGRLHNKVGLMNELGKIRKVMQKLMPDAPHEVLLVLDASTGQNAIEQAKQFTAATDVNALALTKLDGTAKGGVIIGISDQFQIPVRYIGLGEKMTDLQVFNADEFVDSLFDTQK